MKRYHWHKDIFFSNNEWSEKFMKDREYLNKRAYECCEKYMSDIEYFNKRAFEWDKFCKHDEMKLKKIINM